ncbi:CapA family protein [Desertimonas flava]|uniref:CapA family protein n=1 Tax=Desertimonas flava TaxID=2064846 RepID=UPI0013C40162|nr:CapA family protein [Desertimonas flava]
MAFTGDSLWHSPLWAGAQANWAAAHPDGPAGYDFTPMLAGLAPLVANVDLAVCHLETPIAPEGEGFTTAPRYGVPAEVAAATAAAGFDRCSTASNHTLDRGVAGIDRTVTVLEAAGLGVSGMARTPDEIAPRVFIVDGVRVTHLSYTFSYNGLRMPAGEEWRSATIDPARIVADATAARALGAQLVIVSMHWGNEKDHTITSSQREVAAAITASGQIDLVVGHHAHVLQGIEQVNGVWVIYGLGNVVSNMPTGSTWPAASQDAAVAAVSFTPRSDGSGFDVSTPVIHPTWCDRDAGWIVRLVQPTLADPATPPGLRARLEASLARTMTILGPFVPP